ncbi:malate dehydrogenase, mitochondrial-like [Periplaneta americana]|uniref:malate dehydrogenase, mitochondrial-like n=1 Tax=Periplaneta americana TaxID=6978 RepID=UPI0037E91B18
MLLQAVRTSLLNTILTPGNLTRNFYKFLSTSSKSNRFKVTVCGATGGIGQPLSLMLKQSNLVEELALYDVVSTHGVAMDISHVDTKCKIEAYSGPQEIGDALTDAKIVMITAGVPRKPGMSRDDLFDINAGIIKVLSESCLKYCPMALIGIVTNPVNSLVPVAYEVFRQGGLLNENRIFGVTALDSVRANTFVAELTRLRPEDVIVPVIGGHSSKTMVPLFSQTRPCVELSEIQIHKLTLAVQEAGTEVTKAKAGKGSATLATAFAAARFSVALAKALTGESNIIECAYVRSNVCKDCEYLATPLLLGPEGIRKNLGLPKLSDYEVCQLQTAVSTLRDDIKKGVAYIRGEKAEENVCSQYLCSVEQKAVEKHANAECPKLEW